MLHDHTPRRCSRALTARAALLTLVLGLGLGGCNSDSAASPSSGSPLGLPVGSFDIGIPTAVAIRQGGTAVLEVTIIRTAFVAPVFVTLAGLPTGVSAPGVSSTSTNQILLPLSADSVAVVGVKSVQVTAQGSDVPTVTKSFSLTVSPR